MHEPASRYARIRGIWQEQTWATRLGIVLLVGLHVGAILSMVVHDLRLWLAH